MTREEFKIIAKGLKSVYSTPSFIADADAFNVWYELLKDMDYNVCSLAVQNYMATETRIPTVADIRNKAMKFASTGELNEMQAWALVSKALRNGIYNSEKEFNALPETVQKAVGSAGMLHNWATSDYETIETVIMSNFQRTYRNVCARENEIKQMPENVRLMLENVKSEMKLIGKEDYE